MNKPGDPNVMTGWVRLAYSSLTKKKMPYKQENGDPEYVATFIVEPNDNYTISALQNGMQAAFDIAVAKGDFFKNRPNISIGEMLSMLRDGNNVSSTILANKLFFKGKNKRDVLLLDGQNQEISKDPMLQDRNPLYDGCWVRASIWIYPYNVGGNVGFSCLLNGVQFLGDGDKFVGGGNTLMDMVNASLPPDRKSVV